MLLMTHPFHEASCLSFIMSQNNSIFITKTENDINTRKRQNLERYLISEVIILDVTPRF